MSGACVTLDVSTDKNKGQLVSRNLEIIDGLSSDQREAARLETTGETGAGIARAIRCAPATLSRWRALPLYQEHLQSIMAQMDRDTIKAARIARDECLNVTLKQMRELNKAQGDDELCARDRVALAKLALDTYKTLSAQTGVREESAIEHSVKVDPREQVLETVRMLREDK